MKLDYKAIAQVFEQTVRHHMKVNPHQYDSTRLVRDLYIQGVHDLIDAMAVIEQRDTFDLRQLAYAIDDVIKKIDSESDELPTCPCCQGTNVEDGGMCLTCQEHV